MIRDPIKNSISPTNHVAKAWKARAERLEKRVERLTADNNKLREERAHRAAAPYFRLSKEV